MPTLDEIEKLRCPKCLKYPCACPGAGGGVEVEDIEPAEASKEQERGKAAIEVFIYNPDLGPLPIGYREMVENPRIKERFPQYLPVGVYFDEATQALKYYLYAERHQEPPDTIQRYSDLAALAENLPAGQRAILQQDPKLFIIAHGSGNMYGLSGDHGIFSDKGTDDSEKILDDRFDQLVNALKQATASAVTERVITLEGCNVANRQQEPVNTAFHDRSFLEILSERHPEITCCGSAPWDPTDPITGVRSRSDLPLQMTSVTGSVWKSGNWVVFHHETEIQGRLQLVARKSVFASTQSAKALKSNMIDYASAILSQTKHSDVEKAKTLKRLAESPDILTIADLQKQADFPKDISHPDLMSAFVQTEKQLLAQEKNKYIRRVQDILSRSEKGEALTTRDGLILALVLKNQTVFEGHEALKEKLLAQPKLLNVVMVACGKALIGGPDNDQLIGFLQARGIDINTPDKDGRTALHYAVQAFHFYHINGRERAPLMLVKKLIESGANVEAKDKDGCTPSMFVNPNMQPDLANVLKAHGATIGEQSDASDARPERLALSDEKPTKATTAYREKMERGRKDTKTPERSLDEGTCPMKRH